MAACSGEAPQFGGVKILMGRSQGTASMASGRSYSSSVPSYRNAINIYISVSYIDRLDFLQGFIRMQNLRFAHFLCAAQEMSRPLEPVFQAALGSAIMGFGAVPAPRFSRKS